MERITSRKNKIIAHMLALKTSREHRRQAGEFICDGEKLLHEALEAKAQISCILWRDGASLNIPGEDVLQLSAPPELVSYASPLKESAGPVFTVKMRPPVSGGEIKNAIILENLQDPGNVGTVLRTARAFGIDRVLLVGECADIYNPKTVRSTMGAVFTQSAAEIEIDSLESFLAENKLRLYGAALSQDAQDIRDIKDKNLAIAIGSEGQGLSDRLLSMCEGRVIIPMEPESESLNAAVAAAIVMWELYR